MRTVLQKQCGRQRCKHFQHFIQLLSYTARSRFYQKIQRMVNRQGEVPDHQGIHPLAQFPMYPPQIVTFPEFPDLEYL